MESVLETNQDTPDKRNLSPHLSDLKDLEEMRVIYNARLPDDLPLEIECRGCGQPKQLIRWDNKRVAFWGHMDKAVHDACIVKLTFRTSFIQSVAKMWGHWARSAALMNAGDYVTHWETMYAPVADTFLRNDFELNKVDRKWLYANLEGPVLDVGCGNAIDYEGLKTKGYMGVDVTPSFIEAAKVHGVPEECLTLSDARKMPFKDKEYRCGYLKDVLLHWKQVDGYAFIDELLRVCEEAYVVWGHLSGRCFLPSLEPVEERWGDTFYYNVYDLKELEKRYKISFIGEDTTITKIEALK